MKSNFHDGGNAARGALGYDDYSGGDTGGQGGRRGRRGRDGGDEEEVEAQRALETAEEKKLNFNLDAFRPYTVYAMLRWCHMQEYPPTEVPDQFVDGRGEFRINLGLGGEEWGVTSISSVSGVLFSLGRHHKSQPL